MSNLAKLGTQLVTAAKPKLQTILYYAKVELVPPKPNELGQVKDGISRLLTAFRQQKWKQVTVKEAWLNTLVTVEVACWFFVGECIGRGHIAGYDV